MATPGAFSKGFLNVGNAIVRRAVAQQGGLLDGEDPTQSDPSDPIRIWIIELGVIIIATQLLSVVLGKIRQPKVIAEVIGGIVLGPTLFGRIPGFMEHIFPMDARPYLTLTADIGLVLFLFLVGLEIDTNMIKRNARTSFIISAGGICLPFGLGVGVAVPLYNQFIDSSQSFPHFMLFVGVAFSITAFPVLCRILTELKMLDDVIGVVVLSAGVGNDIVGWILLALTVALVNAGSGLTALYILLVSVGWVLVILYPFRWAYVWLARRTGSTEKGPTPLFMTATILLVFGSAFMTDIIGVNAIFGGFLAGLIIPREGALNITITEKLEDMVAIIFLPLYFTLSGLNTNLGLLNNGITWGYTFLILVVAYIGKFSGGTLAARVAGFKWRQSMTVGTLMSCKGLIELIVLNVGLQAGILDTRIFSMFVLEAVVLTFAATPVALLLYPPHLRKRSPEPGTASVASAGMIGGRPPRGAFQFQSDKKQRFLVVLDKMGHVPAIMSVTQLLQPPVMPPSTPRSPRATLLKNEITALRLMELTDRTSDLMRSSVPEELMVRDPVLNVFHMFGGLNDLVVHDRLSVASYEDYHERVAFACEEAEAQLIILSWIPPVLTKSASAGVPLVTAPTMHSVETGQGITPQVTHISMTNPLEALFRSGGASGAHPTGITYHERTTSVAHSHFIRRLFASAPADVALFVDNKDSRSNIGSRAHIMVPFFGGPDDRLALQFAVQLCAREGISANIVRVTKEAALMESESEIKGAPVSKSEGGEGTHLGTEPHTGPATLSNTMHSAKFPDTIYPHVTTQTRIESDTADNICWYKYAPPEDPDVSPPHHTPEVAAALGRITFTELNSTTPLHDLAQKAAEVAVVKRLIVIVGRAKRLAVESHEDELVKLLGNDASAHHGLGNEMRKTLGDVATAFLISGPSSGLLVMQAAPSSQAQA